MKHAVLSRVAIATLLMSAVAQAGERVSHGSQTRHVHGSAQLNLVREGRVVHIELISPAVNLVGFEHAPASEAERTAGRRALSTLEDAKRLFRFDAVSACQTEHTEVTPGSTLTAQTPGPLSDHHHEAHHADPGNAQHNDISATYRFVCDTTDGPVTLHLGLFDAFPAIDDLVIQYISESRQGGATLHRSDPVLTF